MTAALLDMAATYAVLTPPDPFSVEGPRVLFDLPWEIGRFEGAVEGDDVAGAVATCTGEAESRHPLGHRRTPDPVAFDHSLVVPVDALGNGAGVPGGAPGYPERLADWVQAVPPNRRVGNGGG